MIVVRLLLHHGRDALEPRARVHARLRQRLEHPVRLPIVLHEHQVPDLEEAARLCALDERVLREFRALHIGPFARRALRETPILRDACEIHIDLAARPARTCIRHLPEIVALAETVDARVGKLGDLLPELPRFIVLVVDRHPEEILVDAEILRDEFPRELDRVALEVVAEGEIAEHLEERVVARGVPHLLEIVVLAAGAHAFLRRGRALAERRRLLAEEDPLERHHSGIREEQRWIVGGHERARRPRNVAVLLEEIQEFRANLGGEHGRNIL